MARTSESILEGAGNPESIFIFWEMNNQRQDKFGCVLSSRFVTLQRAFQAVLMDWSDQYSVGFLDQVKSSLDVKRGSYR
jgi:hypothetical protein